MYSQQVKIDEKCKHIKNSIEVCNIYNILNSNMGIYNRCC